MRWKSIENVSFPMNIKVNFFLLFYFKHVFNGICHVSQSRYCNLVLIFFYCEFVLVIRLLLHSIQINCTFFDRWNCIYKILPELFSSILYSILHSFSSDKKCYIQHFPLIYSLGLLAVWLILIILFPLCIAFYNKWKTEPSKITLFIPFKQCFHVWLCIFLSVIHHISQQ